MRRLVRRPGNPRHRLRRGATATATATRRVRPGGLHGHRARSRVGKADHDQWCAGQGGDAGSARERADNHPEPEHSDHRGRGGAGPGQRELLPTRNGRPTHPTHPVANGVGEGSPRRERRGGSLLAERPDQPRDVLGQRPAPSPALHAVALVVSQPRVALRASIDGGRRGLSCGLGGHRRPVSIAAVGAKVAHGLSLVLHNLALVPASAKTPFRPVLVTPCSQLAPDRAGY